jgi:hypothetical protein
MFRKVFGTFFPTALFSYAAYLILSGDLANLSAQNQRAFGKYLEGLASILGRIPAGLLLITIGLLMSAFAYRKYFAGK